MKRWELEAAYARRGEEIRELQGQLGRQAAEIGAQRQEIEDLREQVAALKDAVEALQRQSHRQAGRFRRDPEKLSKEPKQAGRKPGKGTWSNRSKPTDEQRSKAEIKRSSLDGCPGCGCELTDLRRHEHFEWDIPQVKPVLTCFVSQSGYCRACGKRVRSRHADQISDATGAAGVVIGPRAKALASDMKHHLGVSYGKISGFFDTVFDMKAGRSGLFRADMRLADRAGPVYTELLDLVRQLWQVHVDETGWRIGTLSAWLWIFCGEGVTVYTIRRSRGHEVVLEILGEKFKGRLTADGLLTYNAAALSDWLQQKCLAHILRQLKTLSASSQAQHVALGEGMTTVLRQALELARLGDEVDERTFAEAAAAIEYRLDELINAHQSDAIDDRGRMARHLNKHRARLLPFLYDDRIEPTNNAAERGLRPGVITRKVGGCNRSDEGANAHAVLASIGATCRQRGVPVLDFLIKLQRSIDSAPSIVAASPSLG